MSLSPGPYSYNRFAGIPRGNTLSDSYRAIYEAKNAKPDFLDMDRDGNKKESFKKAVKDKETGKEQKDCTCEEWVESLVDEGYDLSEYTWEDMERMFYEGMHREVKTGKVVTKAKPGVSYYPNMPKQKSSVAIRKEKEAKSKKSDRPNLADVYGADRRNSEPIRKEEVCQYLMDEGYTNNEVSAEVLFNHMSDEWLNSVVNNIEELYKGKHGQSEKQYQDGRSPAGKMISGDSKGSGANYSYKAKNTGPNPAGGSVRPQGQARMNNKDRAYLKMQKANMKKG